MAYYRIEPFGAHAEEMRFGILASSIISLFVKKETKLDPRNFTYSLRPKVKKEPVAGLVDSLISGFKNAIPRSEWSRKKRKRKPKKE